MKTQTSTERNYPREIFYLTLGFGIKRATVVRPYFSFEADYGDVNREGKIFAVGDMFATRADAITAGRQRIADQEADLAKRSEKLAKRKATLAKEAAK